MLCIPSAAPPGRIQREGQSWLPFPPFPEVSLALSCAGVLGKEARGWWAEWAEGMWGFDFKTLSVSHNSQEKGTKKIYIYVAAGMLGGFENLWLALIEVLNCSGSAGKSWMKAPRPWFGWAHPALCDGGFGAIAGQIQGSGAGWRKLSKNASDSRYTQYCIFFLHLTAWPAFVRLLHCY